eukprot:UC4_evm1s1006
MAKVNEGRIPMSVEPFEAKEYAGIAKNKVPKSQTEKGSQPKNRYADILPNPHSRVRLSEINNDPRSNYINANFVRGWDGTPKQYIAGQGPLTNTLADWWRMIWETEVPCIVMVTGLKEKGRVKCERYWPKVVYNPKKDSGAVRIGSFKIMTLKNQKKDSFIVSYLRVINTKTNDHRDVAHYWYTAWPDHGVPARIDPILKMLKAVNMDAARRNAKAPILVHCSAGIGRTGIELGTHELRAIGTTSVVTTIMKMREDRGGMIQTPDQAVFLHKALTRYAEVKGLKRDEGNSVLRESLKHMEDTLPDDFEVHDSQEDTDPGAINRVPTWRIQTIKIKEYDVKKVMAAKLHSKSKYQKAKGARWLTKMALKKKESYELAAILGLMEKSSEKE